ncbi:alpha-amylase [Olsenella massiliensis]|uniref:alpha-amylase n=1 Tax=Olsenella massiliensis TaxID=1622075 RepID=UPI0009E77D70|nr:alpha-amylase [Olsenella massiliensis]
MNGTMLQGFSWYLPADGKHWERLRTNAKAFAEVGITSVWLPPAYKGQAGAEDVGYGVYDLYDLGEFDQKGSVATKYGTKDEYLAAIRELKAQGIQVLADVVLNHRMGADECEQVEAVEVNADDRTQDSSGTQVITAWSRYTFPGRKGAYSDFVWDHSCFHGCDYDEATQRKAIFRFADKQWDPDVTHENGNYDYLMGDDVDVTHPPVYDELVSWGAWYVDACDLDGFRLDAVKHIERDFYRRWLDELRERTGKELFTVGEYWSSDLDELRGYLGDDAPMSLFDVPLHFKLFQASTSDGQMDLSRLFEGTLVASDPTHAVTFVENHDTQPGQALQSFIEPWFKPSAYACILLREAGYPCVFYGDLFGMPNGGDIPAVEELPLLMEIRRRFAYGPQHDFLDSPDLIGWTREGDDEHEASGVAVLLTDGEQSQAQMNVGASHAGETWRCVIGDEASVTIGDDGSATFSVGGGRLSVYLSDTAIPTLRSDRRRLRRAEAKGTDPSPAA